MNASRVTILSVALLAAGMSTAIAGDICVVDSLGSVFRFTHVKSFAPGRAVPLSGIWSAGPGLVAYTPGETAPVDGTAESPCPGRVEIGVFVHSAKPGHGNNFTAEMVGDTLFNAFGGFDSNGDFGLDAVPTPYKWSTVDCRTIGIAASCACNAVDQPCCDLTNMCAAGTCGGGLACSQSSCTCQVP
jgi:hypothetical protein